MNEKRYKADRTLKHLARGIDALLLEIEQVKATYRISVLPSAVRFSGGGGSSGTSDLTGEAAVRREALEKSLTETTAVLNEKYALFYGLLSTCTKSQAEILVDYYLKHKLLLSIAMDRGISLDSCNKLLALGRDAVFERMMGMMKHG